VIRDHIVHFYNKLFSEQFSWLPKLYCLAFNSIDEEESTWLKRSFKESEVLEVVKCMDRG
jgi:hypothetical protein